MNLRAQRLRRTDRPAITTGRRTRRSRSRAWSAVTLADNPPLAGASRVRRYVTRAVVLPADGRGCRIRRSRSCMTSTSASIGMKILAGRAFDSRATGPGHRRWSLSTRPGVPSGGQASRPLADNFASGTIVSRVEVIGVVPDSSLRRPRRAAVSPSSYFPAGPALRSLPSPSSHGRRHGIFP